MDRFVSQWVQLCSKVIGMIFISNTHLTESLLYYGCNWQLCLRVKVNSVKMLYVRSAQSITVDISALSDNCPSCLYLEHSGPWILWKFFASQCFPSHTKKQKYDFTGSKCVLVKHEQSILLRNNFLKEHQLNRLNSSFTMLACWIEIADR